MRESKRQTFRGHEFHVVRGITHPEYSYFTFESEELSFREEHWNVKPGDVVFDVGASYGAYSLTACAMGATVYAFEPEPTVVSDLVASVALNGWADRCIVSAFGLWSEKALIGMASYAPHWPPQTISRDYEMETLDHFVERVLPGQNQIDWLKIDVEGAEEHVIRGALVALAKYRPRIIVECHTFLDAGIKDRVRDLLSSAHAYAFEEVDRPPCIMLCATPTQDR